LRIFSLIEQDLLLGVGKFDLSSGPVGHLLPLFLPFSREIGWSGRVKRSVPIPDMDEEQFDKFSGLFSQACEKYRINDKEVATSPTRDFLRQEAREGQSDRELHVPDEQHVLSMKVIHLPLPLQTATMKRHNIQDDLQESQPEKVCCLNLHDDMNIGQIVRTAELFGMSEVLIVGRKKYDRRTIVGAEFRIPVTKHWTAKGDHSEKLDLLTDSH
jgi:hypothetical protein